MKIGDSSSIKPQSPNELFGQERRLAPHQNQQIENPSLGRLFKAVVLSVDSDGRVLLSLNGEKLSAQTLVPLKVGQEVWLEVVKGGDVPLLGLASKKGAVVDVMRQLFSLNRGGASFGGAGDLAGLSAPGLPNKGDLTAAIEKFIKIFSEAVQGSEPDSRKVIKQLSLLGLFSGGHKDAMASKGVTQKPLLADLLALMSGRDTSDLLKGVSGGKGVTELVRLFETIGQLNNPVAGQDQQDFLLFPCFFAGESGWGEWLFSFSQENGNPAGENGKYGLTFFLEMSNLGEIQLQIYFNDDAIRGVLSAVDQKVVEYLDGALPELTERLINLDYKPVELSCKLDSVRNLQSLKEQLCKKTGQESFTLLDVTI